MTKITVASVLALSLVVGLTATVGARAAVHPGAQSGLSLTVLPIYVYPNPVAPGGELTVTCQISATYDVLDNSSTSFGSLKSEFGIFNGQPYNRTREKTVTRNFIPDDQKSVLVQVDGLPGMTVRFPGEGPHSYVGTFTAESVPKNYRKRMRVAAQETEWTTKDAYKEYYYRQGNNLTYVGTSEGTRVSTFGALHDVAQYHYFTYRVQ